MEYLRKLRGALEIKVPAFFCGVHAFCLDMLLSIFLGTPLPLPVTLISCERSMSEARKAFDSENKEGDQTKVDLESRFFPC